MGLLKKDQNKNSKSFRKNKKQTLRRNLKNFEKKNFVIKIKEKEHLRRCCGAAVASCCCCAADIQLYNNKRASLMAPLWSKYTTALKSLYLDFDGQDFRLLFDLGRSRNITKCQAYRSHRLTGGFKSSNTNKNLRHRYDKGCRSGFIKANLSTDILLCRQSCRIKMVKRNNKTKDKR